MSNFFICEVCGVGGETPLPAPTCIRCMPRPAPISSEITTFSMGLYTMKVCRGCRQKLGDDGLRNRIKRKGKPFKTGERIAEDLRCKMKLKLH